MGNQHLTPRGKECPKCKKVLRGKYYDSHEQRCLELPNPQEIADMIKDNKPISTIARMYRTDTIWINAILRNGELGNKYVTSLFEAECPTCGKFIKRHAMHHIHACAALPMDKIDERMRTDPRMSLAVAYEDYKVEIQKARRILIHKYGWTDKEIREKGKAAKIIKHKEYHERHRGQGYEYLLSPANKSPRCKRCEILVDKKGDLCMYCKLENNGIKTYKDLYHGKTSH